MKENLLIQNVFAIKIKSYYLPINENDKLDLNERYLRQLSWLKSIFIKDDFRFVYELRIIYLPERVEQNAGKIEFYLIIKAAGIDKQTFYVYCNDLFNLAVISFPEYDFEMIVNEQLQHILYPFIVNFVFELKRTIDNINLDTLGDSKVNRIGFNDKLDEKNNGISESNIFNVTPYPITKNPANTFYKQLVSSKSNYIFSIILRPVNLNDDFLKFINKQILICERFSQLNLSISSDVNSLFPALKEKAKFYQSFQNHILNSLKEIPLTINIYMGSNNVLQDILANTFISFLTGENSKITIKRPISNSNYINLKMKIVGAKNIFNLPSVKDPCNAEPKGKDDYQSINNLLEHTIGLEDAASIFSFPLLDAENLEGIETKRSRQIPTFENFPSEGVEVGVNVFGNKEIHIKLKEDDRRRHFYIVGQTGTGKTNLLKNMILSDIRQDKGLCVIDPHGDLFNELLNSMPASRIKDVVLIDPTDVKYPVGINLLEYKTEEQRYFIAQEMVNILKTLMIDEFGVSSIPNYAGPIFFQHVKMNLLLVMSDPQKMGSLFDFYNVFQINDYWKNWLPLKISDPHLENWVTSVLPNTDYQRQGSDGASLGAYISSKFEQFLFDPLLRNIFSQKQSTIDFKEVMDSGKILLVNLSKGALSQINSRFLGLVIMAKLQSEALQRIKIDKSLRKDFFVYIDEFQSITTENFVTLLSEGRKFRISLILANQFISQIPKNILEAIFGNTGTIASFRVGVEDAEILGKKFYPFLSKMDLINLPNWNAYMSTLNKGIPVPPFSIKTEFETICINKNIVEKIYSNSRNLCSIKNQNE